MGNRRARGGHAIGKIGKGSDITPGITTSGRVALRKSRAEEARPHHRNSRGASDFASSKDGYLKSIGNPKHADDLAMSLAMQMESAIAIRPEFAKYSIAKFIERPVPSFDSGSSLWAE